MTTPDTGAPRAETEMRLAELLLGGHLPQPLASKAKGTKTAQLLALGWRVLPIPNFWRACSLMHDGKGNGNAPFIDFEFPHEWLVIPPDDADMPARKIKGRICALRWAYEQATAGRAA